MPIRVLEPLVAAKIAAGEVVERPASVVKELVENALDAGASQIEVEARDGGLHLLRVTDDGMGIPASELSLAFERHATSKIRGLEDLQAIASLGFRGEALPSIAAVARVVCTSRARGEGTAAYVRLEGGQVAEEGRQGAPFGTTVIVRDLFQSVPARLKFLRSPGAEGAAIARLVTHMALAFPEVGFRLLLNGRLVFHSPGAGNARDVLVEAFGVETAQALLDVRDAGGEGQVRVEGFLSPPSLSRPRRDQQAFFVNRRWVQSRLLSYALDDGYREVLPRGRHPVAVLYISLPLEEVDVNVHPAKAEVRFRRDRDVFGAVQAILRHTLGESVTPVSPLPAAEAAAPALSAEPEEQAFGAPPLFQLPSASLGTRPASAVPPMLRPVGQIGTTYIVAEGPDGMYLVDQHAAHERLVFDELLAARRGRGVEVQGLLEPLAVSLTRGQGAALAEVGGELGGFGFQWEAFGEGAVLLRGVPATLREGEAAETFREVLEDLAQERPPASERERAIAASVACHSSVRAGQVLSLPEMDGLLRQMAAASFPRLCPHGRPTLMHLSAAQMDRGFGRR